MPLSLLARISLGFGGIVLLMGGAAAMTHDDWFAGVFLVGLGIVCVVATFTRIEVPGSMVREEQTSAAIADDRGTRPPPTVPWRDPDDTA